MMALLLCTGFIVTQPISVMAEEIMIFAQTTQQQKQSVSGVIKDATGEPVIGASVLEKGRLRMVQLPILMVDLR